LLVELNVPEIPPGIVKGPEPIGFTTRLRILEPLLLASSRASARIFATPGKMKRMGESLELPPNGETMLEAKSKNTYDTPNKSGLLFFLINGGG
jgi:hypothetical protein